MKVEFLEQFEGDLNKVSDQSLKDEVFKVILELERAKTLRDVRNIKKLKGYRNSYRIRIRNYRIGFKLERGVIELARFLDRKEIYRFFP
jgi:mRNA interferase RelE/StbE